MEKVKVINKKTKVTKIVEKKFASDYLGTKEWELAKEENKKFELPKIDINKEEK
jgi:hypothetical protein